MNSDEGLCYRVQQFKSLNDWVAEQCWVSTKGCEIRSAPQVLENWFHMNSFVWNWIQAEAWAHDLTQSEMNSKIVWELSTARCLSLNDLISIQNEGFIADTPNSCEPCWVGEEGWGSHELNLNGIEMSNKMEWIPRLIPENLPRRRV